MLLDVRLGHVERHDGRIPPGQQVERRPDRIGAARLGDLRERLPLERAVRRVEGDLDRRRPAAPPQVLAGHRLDRLLLVGVSRRRKGHASRQQRRAQARGRGVVRVLVGEHLHATRARGVDLARQRERQAPVVGPQCLHVADDPDDMRLVRDPDHFLDRGDDPDVVVSLVADVARVEAAEFPRDLRQLDDLLGLRVAARDVEQPARQAEGPLLHPAANQRPHAIEFVRRRRSIGAAHHRAPHRAVADQERDVRPEPAFLELHALRREIDGPAAVRIRDDRRDPLRQERLPLLQLRPDESFGSVRMHVDEPGCDEPVGRVNRGRRLRGAQPADGRDAPTANADVGPRPRIARAVHDATVANQDIECGRRLSRLERPDRGSGSK